MEDNRWSHPEQIHRLLHTLKTQRIAVAVRFTGESDTYSSMVLDSSSGRKLFLIDELKPEDGNRKLHTGQEFLIEAHALGAEFSIRHLQQAGTQKHGNAVLTQVAYPEFIHHHQRRSAFRVEVPASSRAIVRLYGSYRERPLKGRMLDLSGTGCRVRASGNISPEVRAGEPFERCEIEVPGHAQVSTSAEVRFVEPNASIAATTFGVAFRRISQREEREIFKLVQDLQRVLRRSGLA